MQTFTVSNTGEITKRKITEYITDKTEKLFILLDRENLTSQKALKEMTAFIDDNPNAGYTCTGQEYIDQYNHLCRLAERIIDDYPNLDIFQYLPTTKAGNFAKNNHMLLKSSEIHIVYNNNYFTRSTMQLRLVPTYASEEDWIEDKKQTNVMLLDIQFFNANVNIEPIFDKHDQPRIPEKIKYIKTATPGTVYSEKDKNTEYLYVGGLKIQYKRIPNQTNPAEDVNGIQNLQFQTININHAYIRMTKQLHKIAETSKNLGEFLLQYMIHKNNPDFISILSSIRQEPRKFTTEIKKLFDPPTDDIIFHTPPLKDTYTDEMIKMMYKIKVK